MTEPVYGSDEWADATFPARGETPSNDVVVDEGADEAPNAERPCDGEVADD